MFISQLLCQLAMIDHFEWDFKWLRTKCSDTEVKPPKRRLLGPNDGTRARWKGPVSGQCWCQVLLSCRKWIHAWHLFSQIRVILMSAKTGALN